MTEDAFRDRIVRPRLKARGAVVVVYPKTRFTKAGTADLLVGYRGRFIAIELKRPDDAGYDVTPLQHAFLTDVRKAGCIGLVARDWEQIENTLDSIDASFTFTERRIT